MGAAIEFADHTSAYTYARRFDKTGPNEAAADFYKRAKLGVYKKHVQLRDSDPAMGQNLVRSFCRLNCEELWYLCRKPYYKVWPGVIPMLANVEVKIPFKYLKLPFSAFAIRFPVEHDLLCADDGSSERLKSLMVCRWNWQGANFFEIIASIGVCNFASVHVEWSDDASIEDAVNSLTPTLVLDNWSRLREACLRIAVSVCFLATGGDKLVQPELLSADLAAYLKAQREGRTERAEQIVAAYHKRGKRGWDVGKEERLRPWLASNSNGRPGNEEEEAEEAAHHGLSYSGGGKSGRTVHCRTKVTSPDGSKRKWARRWC